MYHGEERISRKCNNALSLNSSSGFRLYTLYQPKLPYPARSASVMRRNANSASSAEMIQLKKYARDAMVGWPGCPVKAEDGDENRRNAWWETCGGMGRRGAASRGIGRLVDWAGVDRRGAGALIWGVVRRRLRLSRGETAGRARCPPSGSVSPALSKHHNHRLAGWVSPEKRPPSTGGPTLQLHRAVPTYSTGPESRALHCGRGHIIARGSR